MKKTFYHIICAASLLGGLTACEDFFDVKPQDVILFDDFWNEKTDVDAIVAGIYSGMQSEGMISRMMVWGEFRSDNINVGGNIDKNLDLEKIFKEDIKATNSYTTWSEFYNIINRCNTVIQYAPGVAERDPSYTESELRATIAEVSALRDLCYFYLIRTFRDVPYTTQAFIEDSQRMDLPATPFNDVLDSLITDLENIKGDAIKRYPETKPLYQTGRITQDAIHAMLCEMYLWKKDYINSIHYADLVIQSKLNQEEEAKNNSNSMQLQEENIFNGYPLIKGESGFGTGYNTYGNAYNNIFGEGNSKEAIFELTFMKGEDNMLSNGAVNSLYSNGKVIAGFAAPSDFIGQDISASSFRVYNNKYDARSYENIYSMGSGYVIAKFARVSVRIDVTNNPFITMFGGLYPENKNKSNWIIYRLTDIMLLKAEALVQTMTENTEDKAWNDSIRREAFTLVNAVNKRSMCQSPLKDTLVYKDYNTKTTIKDLVLLERQRELMFEGKRWYDLVRHSICDGNTQTLRSKALQKYSSNTSAIESKLTKMDAIFWPYNYDELRVNKNLKQNPAFPSGEEGSYENSVIK